MKPVAVLLLLIMAGCASIDDDDDAQFEQPAPGNGQADDPTLSGLPEDCLLTRDDAGIVYCFSPANRELIAQNPNSSLVWRTALAGNNDDNPVTHLAFAGGQLVVVSTRVTENPTAYDYTVVDGSGVIRATRSLSSAAACCPVIEELNGVIGIPEGLVIALTTASSGIDAGTAEVQRIEPANGDLQAIRSFSELESIALSATSTATATQLIRATISGNQSILLEPVLLGSPSGAVIAVETHETLRERTRQWLSPQLFSEINALMSSPALQSLLSTAVASVDGSNFRTFLCPEGGTVTDEAPVQPQNSLLQTYRFGQCGIAGDEIDGYYSRLRESSFATAAEFAADNTQVDNLSVSHGAGRHITVTGFANIDRSRNDLLNGCTGQGDTVDSIVGIAYARILSGEGLTEISDLERTTRSSRTRRPLTTLPGELVRECEELTERSVNATAVVESTILGGSAASLNQDLAIRSSDRDDSSLVPSSGLVSLSFGNDRLSVELLDAGTDAVLNTIETPAGSESVENVWNL